MTGFPDVGPYDAAIREFTEERLRPYLRRLERWPPNRTPRGKEVNDAVWGTLTLQPVEVVILDSPLLQRLRAVRQLGVVHLVYPTAVHTRLEHSIGAVHLVERLVSAMNAAADERLIKTKHVRLLRLAALCHDVGHGLMSHVSEKALQENDGVADMLNEFRGEYGDDKSLGEIASSLMLRSPAFAELLVAAQELTQDHLEFRDAHKLLAEIVLGASFDDDLPTLQELISGPFDADKLDYMTRDAQMSGVPVVTDVNRLVHKARAVKVRINDLPPRIAQRFERDTEAVLTGIARSGNRTLDELTLGRTLHFDKIYRHHKVRAAEQMINIIFRQFGSAVPRAENLALLALELEDEAILRLDLAWPASLANVQIDDRAKAIAQDIARRLRDRELFVRAASFSSKMPGDAYESDPGHVRGLEGLLSGMSDSEVPLGLSRQLAKDTEALLRLVGDADVLDLFHGRSLVDYIAVDAARPAPSLPTSKALLMGADKSVVGFDSEAPETPNWANSYHQTRELAFVFAPNEVATPVALAAERLLRSEYLIRLPRSMMVFGPGDEGALEELRRKATAAGFYDAHARDLRARATRLKAGDVPGRLPIVARRLAGYSPPLKERTSRDEIGIGDARIEDWVGQFEDDELISSALQALEQLKLVGRPEILRLVRSFLDDNPEFRSASIVPLGTPKDSSSINTYYALDVAQGAPDVKAEDLGDALLSDEPIIFIDDISHSGRQATAILQAWFGDPALANELGEARPRLPPDLRRRLRERPVALLFATATDDAITMIEGAVDQFVPTIRRLYDAADLPSLFSVPWDDDAAGRRFIERCRDVGRQLLPEPKREDRVLGYGNHGLLVVFPYNTPSQTTTCIWSEGEVDGAPWQPLLPRRLKT